MERTDKENKKVYVVAHISDRLRLRAALYCVNATILALGYLLLAVLDEIRVGAVADAAGTIHRVGGDR